MKLRIETPYAKNGVGTILSPIEVKDSIEKFVPKNTKVTVTKDKKQPNIFIVRIKISNFPFDNVRKDLETKVVFPQGLNIEVEEA